MKIIKQGLWEKRVVCKGCKSVLQVEEKDVRYGQYSSRYEDVFEGQCYITCPVCEKQTTLKDVPSPIQQAAKLERAD
jgi:RNase P subunit RPR2